MFVARTLLAEVDMLEQALDELAATNASPEERRGRLEVIIGRLIRRTWDEAARFEAELRTALDGERAIRLRHEMDLRRHGIPVSTDRMDSEPPEGSR
jgi:hypothetical protein